MTDYKLYFIISFYIFIFLLLCFLLYICLKPLYEPTVEHFIIDNTINQDLTNILELPPPFIMLEVFNGKYECSICLEEIKDYVCILNCDHFFHYKCIREWAYINKNNNCPLCRKTIIEIEV